MSEVSSVLCPLSSVFSSEQHVVRQDCLSRPPRIGMKRMRMPVAANTAFAMAEAIMVRTLFIRKFLCFEQLWQRNQQKKDSGQW